MTTSRLRKTFHYPSSSDSNDSADELDEEHQERLISSFQAEDAQKSEIYRNAFLAVPALAILFFLYTSFSSLRPWQAILSISSLGASAYILKFLPVQSPARKGKMAVYRVEASRGPVERYMIPLNSLLAGILLVAAVVSWRKGAAQDAYREAFPAVVLLITLFVRQQLAPLDLEELQRARYEYKGA